MVGQYTTLAVMLPVATAVGYFMGSALDRLFGTTFLRVIFLILGIAAGFVQLIRQVQKDAGEE
jgi:F0F1-type ATP synthase assembly protein I